MSRRRARPGLLEWLGVLCLAAPVAAMIVTVGVAGGAYMAERERPHLTTA